MNDLGDNNAALIAMIMGMMATILMVALAVAVFMAICLWKIFTKAGKPGWAGIIPVYKYMVMAEISGKPAWWGLVINFIPCIGVPIMYFILLIELAKSFGKGGAFGVGLILVPVIFFPILAFDGSTYVGPGGVASDITASSL